MDVLGTWLGEDPATGFHLVRRPDGRILRIADLRSVGIQDSHWGLIQRFDELAEFGHALAESLSRRAAERASTVDERISFGNWIISHLAVPTIDHWSWYADGRPWQDSEWLADVLFALTYRAAGWGGEVILTAVAMATTGLIMGLAAAKRLGGLPLLIAIGVGANVLIWFESARRQTLALPLAAAWISGLIDACDRRRAPSS